MQLDRYQGDGHSGRKFGYVHGDDGGYFFSHHDTLEATLDSLEEDSVDGDGGLDIGDVREFLREKLTIKPLASFVEEVADAD